ncbi:hypothetical protein Atai01_83350 [Amycolatopsis taiwanensis]|uniref:Uncharacterized protein n=1 Tax=Amycolatopsis taiwanensis TaxID=342230 RepID=A0A9W6R9H0_9PSEU|nr:hypothetical protein Atai01_83350 [Amycolatopsis taiwanensis]
MVRPLNHQRRLSDAAHAQHQAGWLARILDQLIEHLQLSSSPDEDCDGRGNLPWHRKGLGWDVDNDVLHRTRVDDVACNGRRIIPGKVLCHYDHDPFRARSVQDGTVCVSGRSTLTTRLQLGLSGTLGSLVES